jgi:hypothetical protein
MSPRCGMSKQEAVSQPCRSSISNTAASILTASAMASPASKSQRRARTRSRLVTRPSFDPHCRANPMGAGLSLSFYDNLIPYGRRQYYRVVQVRKKMESLNPRKIDQRRSPTDYFLPRLLWEASVGAMRR